MKNILSYGHLLTKIVTCASINELYIYATVTRRKKVCVDYEKPREGNFVNIQHAYIYVVQR